MDGCDSVVLSVREPYASSILSGLKVVEFRKSGLRPGIGKLYIHVCGEDPACVQVEAELVGCVEGSPEAIRYATWGLGAMKQSDYDEYYKGCARAYAYVLKNARCLDSPIPLKKLGLSRPPQGIAYVKGL